MYVCVFHMYLLHRCYYATLFPPYILICINWQLSFVLSLCLLADILSPTTPNASLGGNSSDGNNEGNGLISGGHEQLSANDKLLLSLEKQLNIEMKVKNGAENMIQSLQSGHYGRDKKLLAEAQQMLTDSKAKIEFLRLRILKVKQNREHAYKLAKQVAVPNADSDSCFAPGGAGGLMPQRLETSLEERIEELRHRLRIEAAVVDGAKNVIRILRNNKVPDKKALQEVSHPPPPLPMFSIRLFLRNTYSWFPPVPG